MSAKDMCLITKVDKLIKAGVSSLKIEGRMKSSYYIATVVNAYKNAIMATKQKKISHASYITDVAKAANRATSIA